MTESIHRKTISELLERKSAGKGQKVKTGGRQTPKQRNENRVTTAPPFPQKPAASDSSTLLKDLQQLEVNEAHIERLLQFRLQKKLITKASRQTPPPPSFLPVSEKTYEYSKKISDSDLPGSTSSTKKPLRSPFRAEQREAISEYLVLTERDSDTSGKFPWEEDSQTAPPVTPDTPKDKSGQLSTASRISSPNRSTPANKADSSVPEKSSSMEPSGCVDFGYASPPKGSSKLYQQLHDHHVRSESRDRLLQHRIEKILKQMMTVKDRWWVKTETEYILMLRQFGVSMQNAFKPDSNIDPLGVFTLAKWGINPYRSEAIRKSQSDLEVEDYDEFGEVKQERLIAISQS
jgi:hypothetical protein